MIYIFTYIANFLTWLGSFFKKDASPKLTSIPFAPKYNQRAEVVRVIQKVLAERGFYLSTMDDWFFNKMRDAVMALQKEQGFIITGKLTDETLAALGFVVGEEKVEESPVGGKKPKWKALAETYLGMTENTPSFVKLLVPMWNRVGLPELKIINKAYAAWCALFIAFIMFGVGYKYQESGLASSYRTYAQEVNWKRDGIPEGAIVQLNHNEKCIGEGNHVAFADGDCTAADLLKAGATINLLGGNQNNMVKVSTYSVKEICAVRWPNEEPLPALITKSNNCTTGAKGTESTR